MFDDFHYNYISKDIVSGFCELFGPKLKLDNSIMLFKNVKIEWFFEKNFQKQKMKLSGVNDWTILN